MKILVTAFDAFGGDDINAAQKVLEYLPEKVAGARIVKSILPTVFGKSISTLYYNIEKYSPNIVLCTGQAGGRMDIGIERIAVNINDASIEDNEGNKPADQFIFEDGPAAYFSNLPMEYMVKNIRKHGIPASISNTAGTFVCNHIMYGLLYLIDRRQPSIKGGFIHMPYLPEQVASKQRLLPSMNVNDILNGLIYAIEAIIEGEED
ncbi:MAG: pyroglutamyl-peptidase I [Xylanivirga thermophila]|jgi:pyroglutamyl-peptidase|uniref:pyroglutamyl-peptidase I n=1 Tax=Xylanivirga thermophila TaxID=2496273 RepID=UPI0039F5BC3B